MVKASRWTPADNDKLIEQINDLQLQAAMSLSKLVEAWERVNSDNVTQEKLDDSRAAQIAIDALVKGLDASLAKLGAELPKSDSKATSGDKEPKAALGATSTVTGGLLPASAVISNSVAEVKAAFHDQEITQDQLEKLVRMRSSGQFTIEQLREQLHMKF